MPCYHDVNTYYVYINQYLQVQLRFLKYIRARGLTQKNRLHDHSSSVPDGWLPIFQDMYKKCVTC